MASYKVDLDPFDLELSPMNTLLVTETQYLLNVLIDKMIHEADVLSINIPNTIIQFSTVLLSQDMVETNDGESKIVLRLQRTAFVRVPEVMENYTSLILKKSFFEKAIEFCFISPKHTANFLTRLRLMGGIFKDLDQVVYHKVPTSIDVEDSATDGIEVTSGSIIDTSTHIHGNMSDSGVTFLDPIETTTYTSTSEKNDTILVDSTKEMIDKKSTFAALNITHERTNTEREHIDAKYMEKTDKEMEGTEINGKVPIMTIAIAGGVGIVISLFFIFVLRNDRTTNNKRIDIISPSDDLNSESGEYKQTDIEKHLGYSSGYKFGYNTENSIDENLEYTGKHPEKTYLSEASNQKFLEALEIIHQVSPRSKRNVIMYEAQDYEKDNASPESSTSGGYYSDGRVRSTPVHRMLKEYLPSPSL
uniref:Uncharacterized protein n=1 Tax=Corethron hystrix TaxID=216773 RepID=A0A7S1B4W6_9STRA